MNTIPELPHGCGSWIVVERDTGRAVFESFSRRIVQNVNNEKYEVRTAVAHLASLNAPQS